MAENFTPEPDREPSDLPGSSEAPHPEGDGDSSTGRHVLKTVLVTLGGLLGVVVLLLAGLFVMLQTDWGAERAKNLVVERLNALFDGAALNVGRLDGNFIGHLVLTDVNLVRADGERMAHVDTLNAAYRLLPLLKNRLHLTDIYVASPTIRMEQRADSTWDLFTIVAQDSAAVDTAKSRRTALVIELGHFDLRNGTVQAHFYAPGRDSILIAGNLGIEFGDMIFGDNFKLRLDTLFTRITPAGRVDDPISLAMSGALDDGRFMLGGLFLHSSRSDVRGRGTLALPSEANRQGRDLDFTLHARPLAFQDVRPFVPALPEEGSVDVNLRVKGSPNRIDATAKAVFSDGARVDLTTEITPPDQKPAAYLVRGQIRGLDPRFLTGDPSLAGAINADIDVDLQGAEPEQVSGRANAVAFDTRFGAYRLDRTALQSTFTAGQGQIDLRTGLRGLSLAVTGTVRPFDDRPVYDLAGQLRNLDIGRFGEGGQQSRISADLVVKGRGIDAETADLTASLTLAPSRVNDYRIRRGQMTARLQNSRLDFDTNVLLPEGFIAAEGSAAFGESIRYDVRSGEIRSFDVAALTGDTTRSRVNARFTLAGAGTDPESMVLRARLDLRDSYYGSYVLDTAALQANVRSEVLRLNGRADLGPAGSLSLVSTIRPFSDEIVYDVVRMQFRRIDVGVLTRNPDQHTDLNGTLAVSGRGSDPSGMTLRARLDLQRSNVNDEQIDDLALAASLRRGTLQFDTRLDLSEGGLTLAGQARPFDPVPTYTIRQGAFTDLNAGALASNPNLQTSLNGTVALDGAGIDPKTMRLDALLALDRSTINDVVLLDGRVRAGADQGRIDLSTVMNLEEGHAIVDARADLQPEEPVYEARGSLRRIDIGRLTGADTLNARFSLGFDVAGQGFDPQTMHLQGLLHAGDTEYGSLDLDTLGTRLRLAAGVLSVDSLLLRSNLATATAGGEIALYDTTGVEVSDFHLTADVVSLEPVRPFIAAEVISLREGHVEARVSGPAGGLRLQADADVNSLIYNDVRVAGASLQAGAVLDSTFSLTEGRGSLGLNYLAIPSITVRQTQLEASYDTNLVTFDARSNVDERRDAQVTARLDLRPESRRLFLDDLAMRLDEQRWTLRQPVVITYGEAYRVDSLVLYSGEQQITASGVIDPNGEQNFHATVEKLRVGAITDLFGYRGLDGTLTSRLDLTGPAPDPILDGLVHFDVYHEGQDTGDLRADLNYDDRRMNLDAVFTHQTGDSLSVMGYVPMDLSLAPAAPEATGGVQAGAAQATGETDLRITSNDFNIDWVKPFLQPETVDELNGLLSTDVHITGAMDRPVLAGRVGLREGRVGMPALGVVYDRILIDAELEGGAIRLRRAEMHSGDGTMVVDGQIQMPELTLGAFDLDVNLDDFRAIRSDQYRATVSGELDLSGTTTAPVVSGDVRVSRADVYLDQMAGGDIRQVQLTDEDVRMLEEFFGYQVSKRDTTISNLYNALALNLGIELELDSWVRQSANPEMAIQFTGRLEVSKRPEQEIQLFRSIEVIPQRSFIRQFGKEFNITRGTITFNGALSEMIMDIAATHSVPSRQNPGQPEVTITLSLAGRLDDLSFELGSDPPMSNTNIVSYVATGKPASDALDVGGGDSGDGGGLLTTGGNIAANQLASMVEGIAENELGLDVIEIEQDGLRGTQLVAGSYVTPRVYVGINQPINLASTDAATAGTKRTEVTMEYETFEWLLLQVLSGTSTSAVRLNVTGRYTFR